MKRPPISKGVTNQVPIPPTVLPGCHAPKLPPFLAVPKYSPGLFSALPAPPPVFPGYTGPPNFPPHLPPQLVPPFSLINPVLPRTPFPSVDAWRRPLEGEGVLSGCPCLSCVWAHCVVFVFVGHVLLSPCLLVSSYPSPVFSLSLRLRDCVHLILMCSAPLYCAPFPHVSVGSLR